MPMPTPNLSSARFQKLTKDGTSDGTVTGSNIATGNTVNIATKNGKKKWQGTVGSQASSPPSTWNASVDNTQWNNDPKETDETVAVTVTNSSGPSNTVDTTSNIP
jgi:hypothetical protein